MNDVSIQAHMMAGYRNKNWTVLLQVTASRKTSPGRKGKWERERWPRAGLLLVYRGIYCVVDRMRNKGKRGVRERESVSGVEVKYH